MRWEYYLFAIVLIITFGVFILTSYQSSSGFSLVYFDNTTLPSAVSPSKNYTISFIIDSHEKLPLNYTYNMYLDNKLISKGVVQVHPMERRHITITFSVDNITYTKVILENTTSEYIATNLENITGYCDINNGTIVCLPPIYIGPAGLNLILNLTGDNVSITQKDKIIDPSTGTLTILNRNLRITKTKEGQYIIKYKELKIQYIPKDVVVRVVVESSNGKSYYIFSMFPVVEGED